ncbi:uncharacterized protein LOC127094487 [Lathyrus oleraceus]|uniref:uncharacterized protein LOC127094487 n=1 Tax=Pisum sativum TaxID=3888 RepID=UPI0021D126AD|nr:uncharacterized protein LOC127094487 [Pisum sativum]
MPIFVSRDVWLIAIPYAELVSYLIHAGAIIPKEIPHGMPPYHPKHNPNASCAYHAGYIGHSTKDYWPLKNKIQELIDQKVLSFSKEESNVKTNPLPNYGGPIVSAVIEEETVESVERVDDVKTPMLVVLKKLEQFGFLVGIHEDYVIFKPDPDYYDVLKGCMQDLMNQGLIQFSRSKEVEEIVVIEPITIVYRNKKIEAPPKRIKPIHIRVPGPFPYQNAMCCLGAGGMSRSGRVFAPIYTPRVSPSSTVVPPKEKVLPTPPLQEGASVPTTPIMTIVPSLKKVIPDKATKSETSKGKGRMVEDEQVEGHKKNVSFEEGREFLKLFKSDFKIVDRLGQTPSKISILSLFLSSEAHRTVLLKVLNIAYVMQDITVDQFDDVVANITTNRYLGFNEAELPPERNAHNKALHILVMCTESLLSRVLVDIGSPLNVIPKATISQLQFKGPKMRNNALIVRAFDGSRRQVFGEVDLLIYVGPHQFTITFQVMDINPAYSCLLGRPWIHVVGEVTSTLH